MAGKLTLRQSINPGIDRFVGHPSTSSRQQVFQHPHHATHLGLSLQPASDLTRSTTQPKVPQHPVLQHRISVDLTDLRPTPATLSLHIRSHRLIPQLPPNPANLTRDHRDTPPSPAGNLTQRTPIPQTLRDHGPIRHRQSPAHHTTPSLRLRVLLPRYDTAMALRQNGLTFP